MTALFFFRATLPDYLQIKKCLQLYEAASGQVVNFEKSALTFCLSSSPLVINEIKNALCIPVVKGHELYLGLPTFTLRSKRIIFAPLIVHICTKIQGWAAKLFSASGKELLIKFVLQVIPSYAMLCFKIPFSSCKEIEKLFAKFW